MVPNYRQNNFWHQRTCRNPQKVIAGIKFIFSFLFSYISSMLWSIKSKKKRNSTCKAHKKETKNNWSNPTIHIYWKKASYSHLLGQGCWCETDLKELILTSVGTQQKANSNEQMRLAVKCTKRVLSLILHTIIKHKNKYPSGCFISTTLTAR